MKKYPLILLMLSVFFSASTALADQIISIQPPSKVSPNEQVSVTFTYISWWKKDVVISLKRTNDWKEFGSKRYAVSNTNGKKVSLSKTFTTLGQIPQNGNYIIEVKIMDKGSWDILSEKSRKVTITYDGGDDGDNDNDNTKDNCFKVKNGKLYDANGKLFKMKGVNIQYIWYQDQTLKSLKNVKQAKANAVRFEWRIKRNGQTTSISTLEKAIKACISQGMVPVLEIHDFTGGTNPNDIESIADYWVKNASLLNRYEKYILLNIANEWGDWNMDFSKWKNAYVSAIKKIRTTGFDGTLIIDGSGSGQRPEGIKKYAKELVNADPKKNVMFSIHMYDTWGDGHFDIDTEMKYFYNKKIAFMVGEFSSAHHRYGDCKLIQVDPRKIMKNADKYSQGYLAWSWKGNGSHKCGDLSYLDMVGSWERNNYTSWGKVVVYDTYGLKSAEACTVFKGQGKAINSLSQKAVASGSPSQKTVASPNPVPVQKDIHIKLSQDFDPSQPIQIRLLGSTGTGTPLYDKKINPATKETLKLPHTQNLKPGSYILRIQQGQTTSFTRIIKQ